jgi:hypothetical protein
MTNERLLPQFYIRYNRDITKDLFNQLIDNLMNIGYETHTYASWDITYDNFVNKGVLRSYLNEDVKKDVKYN